MPLEYALQNKGGISTSSWKLPSPSLSQSVAHVGIHELPRQRALRSKRAPSAFNLMLVGDSGLGKSTFLNTLFSCDLSDLSEIKRPQPAVSVQLSRYELAEEGVTLILSVAQTPGFGDQLNREKNFEPIIKYIESQYDAYLSAEKSREKRQNIPDTRIHALIYFLPPTGGSRLRDIDLEFFQRLCTKVNIIPVVAKADSMEPEELALYKKAVLADFERYDIRIYPTHHAEDRDFVPDVEPFIPFSIVGSNHVVTMNGKPVRVRSYKWGSVEVENPNHCDFVYLRQLLIRTNMQDLIDTTHSVHYSQYRSKKIRGNARPESFLACDDFYETRIESMKRTVQEDMVKRETEMREKFVLKVREKEQSLREREDALNATRQKMMEELESLRTAVEAEERYVTELASMMPTGKINKTPVLGKKF